MTTEQTIGASEIQKIHIGNLALTSTEAGVRELFAAHGEVQSYVRPVDKSTSAPGMYAFIGMAPADAAKAIAALDGLQFDGQAIRVSEARSPRS